MNTSKSTTIDEYISSFPIDVQKVLEEVRHKIGSIAPEAQETISYAIPTFDLNGKHLIHFAGFKNHIGLYPTPVGMEQFKDDFADYKTGKGSVQFPLNEPMPMDLIAKIVKFRLESMKQPAKGKK